MISTNEETILLPTATKMAELEEETVPSVLLPCASCSRTFRPEALSKHSKYCEKTLIKKRKVFDSAKQRIQGTDLAEFLPVLTHKKKSEKSPVRKTQSKWKEKHMELVRAIRAARTGPAEDLPPAALKPCDHEKCPHCDRYFGPKAYDRHLEWCKEHSSRIQPKSPASIQAKERLEARTKYRAPILAKSRRALVREKYQMGGNQIRDPSPMGNQKPISNRLREPSPAERLQKNVNNSPKQSPTVKRESNANDSFNRQQPLRNSRRNPSPMKKTSTPVRSKNVEASNNNTSSTKEKTVRADVNVNVDSSPQDDSANCNLKEKDDIFSASCNITSIKPKVTTKFNSTGTNSSVVPNRHNSSLDNYDPYKSAERQMQELLGLEEKVNAAIQQHEEDNKRKKQQLIAIPPADSISSPTSAFAKFTPIHSPVPSDDNDNKNCVISPSDFNDIIHKSPPVTLTNNNFDKNRRASLASSEGDFIKDKNQNPISLSSLSLCSTISIDSIDSYKNNFRKGISTSAKVQSCDKRVELPLKRSISAVEPPRRGRDFLKGNLKMEDLLYGFPNDHYDRFLGTPVNKNENDSFENLTLSNESLKRSDSIDETSRAEQELLKSMSEFEKLFETPSLKPIPPLIPSSSPAPAPKSSANVDATENNHLQSQHQPSGNKFCSDSAYNSLNRKSPQLEDAIAIENYSSSGSECSFPPIGGHNSQVARFCHECGAKYPVTAAKFCCQCGVRRLVI